MLSFQITNIIWDACLLSQEKTDSWRDPTGRLIASVWYHSDQFCFEVPGTAVFECNTDTGTVIATALDDTSPAVVRGTYHRSILPFFLHALGYEALHAGAVIVNDRVHAFCATSGTGKSTIVDGLRRRGYGAWADDCMVLTLTDDQILTLSVPFHIRLAKTSPHWAKGLNQPDSSGSIPETYDPDNALTLPLGGIYMLHRGEDVGNEMQLQSLSPTNAVELLITHAYAFSASTTDRRRRMMTQLLNVAASVPIYRFDIPDDYGQLESVLNYFEPILKKSDVGHDDGHSQIPAIKLSKEYDVR